MAKMTHEEEMDEMWDIMHTPLEKVLAELNSAFKQFPPFNSAHEGWAIIKEELDELWLEVRSNQKTPGRDERMAKEAIQVAAMALRFLVDIKDFRN